MSESNTQVPPSSAAELKEQARRASKRLWTCEMQYRNPVATAEICKVQRVNLFLEEMKAMRFDSFSEGLMIEIAPARWMIVPPINIIVGYAYPQKVPKGKDTSYITQ